MQPSTKPEAPSRVFFVLLSPPPAKYERYTGSIGRRQGDIKVIIPSTNDTRYCIFPPRKSFYIFILAFFIKKINIPQFPYLILKKIFLFYIIGLNGE